MVPLDQPRAALDMLRRFVRGQRFSDSEQTSIGVGSCSGKDALDCRDEADCASSPPSSADWPKRWAVPATPKIVGTPVVGPDFAVVDFRQGGDADVDDEVGVSFEVRSSPDGIVGSGAFSPVRVDGLTPGRAYTFSVTAVHSAVVAAVGGGGGTAGGDAEVDGGGVVRSNPSVGSPAVTPGCGKEAGAAVQRDCSGHGACREDGKAGVCVCENGYAGDTCEIMLAGGIRGGGGGSFVAPGTGVLAPTAERTGDIKLLLEEDVPILHRSGKVRIFGGQAGVVYTLGLGVGLVYVPPWQLRPPCVRASCHLLLPRKVRTRRFAGRRSMRPSSRPPG